MTYQGAVAALNSLQTNAAVIEAQRKSGGRDLSKQIPEMVVHLQSLGISLHDVNGLNIVHVTGSKV